MFSGASKDYPLAETVGVGMNPRAITLPIGQKAMGAAALALGLFGCIELPESQPIRHHFQEIKDAIDDYCTPDRFVFVQLRNARFRLPCQYADLVQYLADRKQDSATEKTANNELLINAPGGFSFSMKDIFTIHENYDPKMPLMFNLIIQPGPIARTIEDPFEGCNPDEIKRRCTPRWTIDSPSLYIRTMIPKAYAHMTHYPEEDLILKGKGLPYYRYPESEWEKFQQQTNSYIRSLIVEETNETE